MYKVRICISTTEGRSFNHIIVLILQTSASLKFTVLNPKGRIWTMVAGGGASVIYADTVSCPKTLCDSLDDSIWSKDIAIDATLSITGRLEIWVMHLSLVIMQSTVELQMRRRCCNMPELLSM